MNLKECLQDYETLDTLSTREAHQELALIAERLWKISPLLLITSPQFQLNARQVKSFKKALQRRRRGEPLAYILGEQGFYRDIYGIDAAALVPRPETECLIDWTLDHFAESKKRSLKVLEIGTGSGVISLSLASLCPQWRITATDISIASLRLAAHNAYKHKVRINFLRTDLFPARSTRYDFIVTNPPYVAHYEHIGRPHLKFEPRIALVGGTDGLHFVRKIIRRAPHYLKKNGWLLMEHGWKQHHAVQKIFRHYGYNRQKCLYDLAGKRRGLAACYC